MGNELRSHLILVASDEYGESIEKNACHFLVERNYYTAFYLFSRYMSASDSPGSCKAYIPSWRYDSVTRQCKQFVYGGCQGNENNFSSKQACENTCPHKGEVHERKLPRATSN